MHKLICIALFFVGPLAPVLRAQQSAEPYMPREKVIFEDNFCDDSAGTFPKKWELGPDNTHGRYVIAKYFCEVSKDGEECTLHYTKIGAYFIQPSMTSKNYLPDSFTFEFDVFFLSPTSYVDIGFCVPGKYSDIVMPSYRIYPATGALTDMTHYPGSALAKPIKDFDRTRWHHLALSYNARRIKYFVDGLCGFTISDCHYKPNSLAIEVCAPTRLKNVRLATGAEMNPIKKILTENKLITHSILFDVNKSVVKEESMGFIAQLVKFLKDNPSVALEIDGHTDADGSPEANLRLSQDRADAIRDLLKSMGIEGHRLLAKGFGDTRPVKPNTTPEGKAENRRVELIKL